MSEYTKIDSLIWQIYVDTGYYEYVSLMPDGKKRSKNLRMLFERATQYEKTSLKGLFNFIKFIDKLILSNSDMSAAKTIGENDNVVRIMSIHKSKGLEFPVVFLSGTGKKFNMQDMGKSLLIHQDIGLGPDYINADRRISYPTMAKLAVKQKMKLELLSEELRILYVALTRAKEKLIITGIDKNLDKSKEMYSNINNLNKIPVYTASKANNFLSWIEQVIFNEWEILNKKLDINFYLKEDILKDIQVEDTKKVIDNLAIPEDVDTTFIDEQLSWKYKNIELSKIPTKLSVSEIKRRHNLDNIEDAQFKAEQLQSEPKFLSGKKKISNAEKGSIVHLIIQHLSLNKNHTITTIKQEIQNMILKNLLTEEEYESIDVNKIYKFTVSDIYKRMTKSSKVYKEQPFYMSLPVNDIYKDIKGSNTILVQGIIDCFFEEDDGLVLIDYKTDYVENNNLESLVEKYSVQLEYYKKALEEATSKKVKQIYIYSLYCNKAIEKQC